QLLARADALVERGSTEAEAIYRELLARHPGQPELLHRLAFVVKKRGGLSEAESLLRRAIAGAPGDAVLHNNLGNVLRVASRLAAAEACYRKAIALDATYPDAYYNLGVVLEDQARADEALAVYRDGVALRANYAAARTRIGAILHAQGLLVEALAALDAATAGAPDSFDAHYHRGLVLIAMDRFDEGAEALSRAAVLKPDSHDALHTLANALKGAGRYDEAIAALWRAVELQPMSAALHDDLSRLAWEDDRTDMFLKSFAHVRERFDEDPALLTTEAQIRMQRNDAQGAEPLLRRALVLSPERGDTNALLGRLLARRGRFDESYEAFSAAVRVAPQIAAFRNEFGYALLQGNETSQALMQFEEARRTNAVDQLALGGACLAYRAMGDSRYHELCNVDAFVRVFPLAVPDGYSSARSFNAALAEALLSLHTTKAEPLDQTLRGGTQTSGLLFRRKSAMIERLREQIEAAVGDYVREMAEHPTHPFLSRRQEQFGFTHSWSCKLRSSGFHTNHVHPMGWISSAYYVSLPEALDDDVLRPGWLKFGQSHLELGGCDRPEHFVRPAVGHLVLFPSYFWHGTVPFESTSDRLTVAFDVVPGKVDPSTIASGPC
ncbi:MAG: tetratricopeptide repeat protein, partial [Micropepsaceae bacterium]